MATVINVAIVELGHQLVHLHFNPHTVGVQGSTWKGTLKLNGVRQVVGRSCVWTRQANLNSGAGSM